MMSIRLTDISTDEETLDRIQDFLNYEIEMSEKYDTDHERVKVEFADRLWLVQQLRKAWDDKRRMESTIQGA